MDCNTLADFRRALYACFRRAGDALMNLVDALSAETPARSVAELSLSPFFERQWPSVYEAFQDANIDRDALQKLFAQHAPQPETRQRFVLGGDASSILRVESKTGEDRTYVHAANLPDGVKPVRPGWQFSTLSVLPEAHSSWTYVLRNDRIASTDTQASVMKEQLTQVLPLLPALPLPPLWIGDGYYGSCVFLEQVADLSCDVLARLGKNRVLFRDPPPGPAKPKRGHPTWHGARFACHDPATHGAPDAVWEQTDANGHKIEVACWHGLHFKKAREVRVSVIRVTRHAAADTKRDPKVSWFIFQGKAFPPLGEIPRLYARRYSLEHAYRVDKQDLLWERPRLRTPRQFEHWTDVVTCTRNQLFLSRDLAGSLRQRWESARRGSTPGQVRRCMGRILAQLGTPARGCRPRGKSPGWVVGRVRKPVRTYRVVFKASGTAKPGQKSPVKPSKPIATAA